MTRETVGSLSLKVLSKEPDTRDPIELQREIQKDWDKHITECIEHGKKRFPLKDFFVVVITKKERLMSNVLRNYFNPRLSCPTPDWDQIVYWYHHKDERLEFLWVIPSRDTCELFQGNILSIAEEERELLAYVLDFEDGTLLAKAKHINEQLYGKGE